MGGLGVVGTDHGKEPEPWVYKTAIAQIGDELLFTFYEFSGRFQ
jgi:hypothetical protein